MEARERRKQQEVAPVILGAWAEYRGEREVYAGVSLAAAIAAFLFVLQPPEIVFILRTGESATRGEMRRDEAVFQSTLRRYELGLRWHNWTGQGRAGWDKTGLDWTGPGCAGRDGMAWCHVTCR